MDEVSNKWGHGRNDKGGRKGEGSREVDQKRKIKGGREKPKRSWVRQANGTEREDKRRRVSRRAGGRDAKAKIEGREEKRGRRGCQGGGRRLREGRRGEKDVVGGRQLKQAKG